MKTMKILRKSQLSENHANSFANGGKTMGKELMVGNATVIYAIAFVMLAAFSLTSCSDADWDWDPMIWKAEVPVQMTDGVYNVSETGGEFIFSCRNYLSPWLASAESNGERYFPPYEANDYHTITTDWFNAEINGNILKIVFKENDTEEERPLQLNVTAGNIFYTFKFKQFANR